MKKSDDNIHKDYPKSLIYAEQACAIAEKLKIPKKAEAYYYIARCLIFIGKYKESKIFLDKGMDEKFVKKVRG